MRQQTNQTRWKEGGKNKQQIICIFKESKKLFLMFNTIFFSLCNCIQSHPHVQIKPCWNNRPVSLFVCIYSVCVGWKYSWHNIISRGPYGKLAAGYLSLSSLQAKISTSLFVALSWTPTTVIGLIITKNSPAGIYYTTHACLLCFHFDLSLTFCLLSLHHFWT